MKSKILLIAGVLAMLVTTVPALAEKAAAGGGSAADLFVGSWKGIWNTGKRTGTQSVILERDASSALAGTLQFTSGATDELGSQPMPLKMVKLEGRKLTFEATAADGNTVYTTPHVSADGSKLDGFVTVRGYQVRMLYEPRGK